MWAITLGVYRLRTMTAPTSEWAGPWMHDSTVVTRELSVRNTFETSVSRTQINRVFVKGRKLEAEFS